MCGSVAPEGGRVMPKTSKPLPPPPPPPPGSGSASGLRRVCRRCCCCVPRGGRRRRLWPACCSEENARFALLGALMLLYMLVGAVVFMLAERGQESELQQRFRGAYEQFLRAHGTPVEATDGQEEDGGDGGGAPLVLNVSMLDALLREYGEASAAGVIDKRPRWDFAGSFYFVATVVSTIGYGMTTPRTAAGKILVVLYGFLGCSGAILFFNLFLERIITLLARLLRCFHERELRRLRQLRRTAAAVAAAAAGRRSSDAERGDGEEEEEEEEEDEYDDEWKPSVYWVMAWLWVAACAVASLGTLLYASAERWSYLEAAYFCFISFATIGFGDYVSSQEVDYPWPQAYRACNFVLLALGSCCVYSLFNVTSIVIKQFLNWLIRRLADCRCPRRCPCRSSRHGSPSAAAAAAAASRQLRTRRNALTLHGTAGGATKRRTAVPPPETDSDCDSDDERHLSGDMSCVQDFLHANKVSLAVMQKQLYETAQLQRGCPHPPSMLLPPSAVAAANAAMHGHAFSAGSVGPLAIVTSKLGGGDGDAR